MSMRSRLVLLIVIFVFVCGCADSNPTPPPKVVRRKIASTPSVAETTRQNPVVKSKDQNKSAQDPATTLLALKDDAIVYHYQGVLNPFLPLIKEKKEDTSKTAPDKKKKKRTPKTALEKIDLTQLTLTAIFKEKNHYKGLVEEPTGKGHIVTTGMSIGLDGGRISNILKDKILITEVSENVMGKTVTIKRELKLRQSSGE
ncbi:MAG: hypothetical protein DSY90_06360 [Deltaproteobacteria bacterium]|nr:MAG: hypothetical protein DSY90_06360 [Deltaproteobacteria bacterium]